MIELVPVTSFEQVVEIYLDPEIFSRISEDGTTENDVAPAEHTIYLQLLTEDGCIGILEAKAWNATTMELHISILKQWREKYAPEAGTAILDWFVYASPIHFHKILAIIPEIYQDVCGFVEKHGLTKEGVLTKAITKQGKHIDLIVYGMTRNDAYSFLRGE